MCHANDALLSCTYACTLATIQKLNYSDSLGILEESQVDSKVLLKSFQHVLKSSGRTLGAQARCPTMVLAGY